MKTSLAALALLCACASNAAEQPPTTIRWVVAHNIDNRPFEALVGDFTRRLAEKTGGRLKVERVQVRSPQAGLDDAAFKAVLDGEAEMSQIGAGSLFDNADSPLNVLDLPFVFRSHAHAEAFFASPVSRRLLAGVGEDSRGKARGLAFTYSGGWRVLIGTTRLEKPADFASARFSGHRGGLMLASFLKELGASVTGREGDTVDLNAAFAAGKINLMETELSRLDDHPAEAYRKYVNVTRHRMYMTAIVANERFLSGLPADLREIFLNEVAELARAERALSIELERRNREELAGRGLPFVDPSMALQERMRAAGQAVHARFPRFAALAREIAAIPDAGSGAAERAAGPTAVRWVLAHTRADEAYAPLFESFASRLERRSGGTLKVEFVGRDIAAEDSDGAAQRMLLDGAADLGQFERDLARDLPAVTAPFAFRDYAHAEAVFSGPVGRKLLEGLYAAGDRKLRALAFAYSGGRRVFFGVAPLSTLAAFKGQRMESPGNSGWSDMMDELMKRVGVRLVAATHRFDAGAADQFESVVNRGPGGLQRLGAAAKAVKYVNRTNHGLLVTTIVANERFLAGLSAEQRRVLEDEINVLAAEERKLSIALEPRRLEELERLGLVSVELPAEERRKLMELSDAVIKERPEVYKTLQEIRAVKDPRTARL